MPTNATTESVATGVAGTARILNVSADTVRRLIADGDLPAFRCGRGKQKGHLRIRLDAIHAFIQRREQEGV